MSYLLDDTIAALASAPGGAARAIVRVSGPRVLEVLQEVLTSPGREHFAALRGAGVVSAAVRWSEGAEALPCDVYVWPNRRSYTREPAAELHTLGSPPLAAAALAAVCRAGARPAQRGEFTLRAFLAGRIDLTQAEAVLGVIDARDEADLAEALGQLAGGLARPLAALRARLLDLLADVEAGLDFVDQDLSFISPAQLVERLAGAGEQLRALAEQLAQRGETADAVRIVLYGRPNVGKSSLFNALAADAEAIVSPAAGTTRDFLTASLALRGVPCELVDTAGLHGTQDGLSAAAAAADRAQRQRAAADVRVLCLDLTRAVDAWEASELRRAGQQDQPVVWNKLDRAEPRGDERGIAVSALSGAGLDALRAELAARVGDALGRRGAMAGTAVRCRESLRCAAEALARARDLAASSGGEELIAAEIRLALAELGKVVGAVYTDDLLDRIFSRFCIGK